MSCEVNMTKIKLCGIRRLCDIEYVNKLQPEYVGFVFAKGSKRYISPETAVCLKQHLDPAIASVGVFVNEETDKIIDLYNRELIRVIQLHGDENEDEIERIKSKTNGVIIKAFRIKHEKDLELAKSSSADYVLLDSGCGTGETFDWTLLQKMERPFFLAGGLTPENVQQAIQMFHPFAVDASSSLETDGWKDFRKMAAFTDAVRSGKD